MEPSPPDPKRWWSRKVMDASGILRVRTVFLSRRPSEGARRKLWRPSLRANLILLGLALLGDAAATAHRRALDGRFARLLAQSDSAPFEIKRIREDLADQEMDEKALVKELDARLKYARSVKAHDFYIVLDTGKQRFDFKYGDKVVRDACFDTGGPRTIVDKKTGARWTFAPVTGAFSVTEKREDADWTVPAWVYAMNREKAPKALPTVPGGLGRYVLVFSGGYVIHSPPPSDSPLRGAKPGSFMVPEQDLAAVWRRIG
ncbi:MAG TPA: L,D-transpeptidase, partial [Thermoanaerobaculia bacterium]|nr:L,D-transpeptidase [Thermoanaerobaculia bacterium]